MNFNQQFVVRRLKVFSKLYLLFQEETSTMIGGIKKPGFDIPNSLVKDLIILRDNT